MASINFNSRRSTGVVLLDLEKAYDSIWHDGLLHKLLSFGYPMGLIQIISSYLSERTTRVNFRGSSSSSFSVPAGVPQGSILSPHLFNVFINDIPTPEKCDLAMYADDTAIICEVPWRHASILTTHLSKALEKISAFFSSWKICLNPSKTEFSVFTKSPKMIRKLNETPIVFNGHSFHCKPRIKYLGVILVQKLLLNSHIDWVIHKASNMVRTLYPLLKRNNNAQTKSKIHAYRGIIRPILTYACPIFANCAERHFKKLQIQQNKILRMALNADWFTRTSDLHKMAKVPTIREYVNKITDNFYLKAKSHTNQLVSSLGLYKRESFAFGVKHRLPRSI